MRLHDRTLFGELTVPFWIGLSAFLTMLVGNTLFQLLEQMMRDRWPLAMVARVLLFNIPTALQYALPVACALAPGLAYGRLARDSEITALRAGGLSLRRLAVPAVVLGLLAGASGALLTERAVPWAWREQNNVEGWLANLPVSSLDRSLTFTSDPITVSWWRMRRTGPRAFAMEDVTVLDRGARGSQNVRVTRARGGEYRAGVWTLREVAVHEFDARGRTLWDARARTLEMPLTADFGRGFLSFGGEQLQNLSFVELSAQRARSADPRRRLELDTARWFKFAIPALCAPLALLAVPLALRFGRSGGFAGVLSALTLALAGQLLLFGLQGAVYGGRLPAPVGAFLPAVLFAGVGLILLRRRE